MEAGVQVVACQMGVYADRARAFGRLAAGSEKGDDGLAPDAGPGRCFEVQFWDEVPFSAVDFVWIPDGAAVAGWKRFCERYAVDLYQGEARIAVLARGVPVQRPPVAASTARRC